MRNYKIWENLSILGKLRFIWICYNDIWAEKKEFKDYIRMTAKEYIREGKYYDGVSSFDDYLNFLVEMYLDDGCNPAEVMEKVFASF